MPFQSLCQEMSKITRHEPDHRVKVDEYSEYPWSTICRINTDNGHGSGTVISSNLVLTAAHVVKDVRLEYLEIIPAYSSEKAPFGVYTKIKEVFIHPKYKDGDSKYDVAIIHLEEWIGHMTGWVGIREPYRSSSLTIAGYPGDLSEGEKMYKNTGDIIRQNNVRFYYHFATYNGMSGSGLLDDEKYLIGVHSGGTTDENYGVRINTEILNWLNAYHRSFVRPKPRYWMKKIEN